MASPYWFRVEGGKQKLVIDKERLHDAAMHQAGLSQAVTLVLQNLGIDVEEKNARFQRMKDAPR